MLQLYFKKLQISLPTQNYDYVTDKTNVKAGSIPKSSNEKYIIEHEEGKETSPLFNYLKTSDQQVMVDIMLNETQDEIKLRPHSFDIVLLVDTKETCG